MSNASFEHFGNEFQEKIVQAILIDKMFAEQMYEVLNDDYFDLKYLRILVKKYFDYYKKYNTFPSFSLLVTIMRDELQENGEDNLLKGQIVSFLHKIKSNPLNGDLGYVKEKSLEFCKMQSVKEALIKSVDMLDKNEYDDIVSTVNEALNRGAERNLGHDYKLSIDERSQFISRNAIPTGFPALDQKNMLDGGLGAGELGVVVAGSGVGKCCVAETNVRIKHEIIEAFDKNGNKLDDRYPWTNWYYLQDSEINSYDIQIKRSVVERRVCIKHLFDEVGIKTKEEGFIKNDWDISIETPEGYYTINHFYISEKQSTRKILLDGNLSLRGAKTHKVMTDGGWMFLKDINVNDFISTAYGMLQVKKVYDFDEEETLYDFNVDKVHCYFSNDILSHNSMCLVIMAANAMRIGKNVIYYTFELSEKMVGKRFDANFTNISQNEIHEFKNTIKSKLSEIPGKLYIKEFPTKSATVQTLKAHINRLSVRDFVPDIIFIDYGDIMKGTRYTDTKRLEVEGIYEDLRALAMERKIPIWTASQSNRDAHDDEIVDVNKISESFNKVMVSDFVMTLSRKLKDKVNDTGRLYIAKNRAGKDGIVLPFTLVTSTVQMEVHDKLDQGVVDRMIATSSGYDMKELIKDGGIQSAFKDFKDRKKEEN